MLKNQNKLKQAVNWITFLCFSVILIGAPLLQTKKEHVSDGPHYSLDQKNNLSSGSLGSYFEKEECSDSENAKSEFSRDFTNSLFAFSSFAKGKPVEPTRNSQTHSLSKPLFLMLRHLLI
ncbi:MAG: hypothetical protein LCH37_04045 [Bacteroidetes bacterium]|nr:hypothetical protein [Bacteroidota bacterium]